MKAEGRGDGGSSLGARSVPKMAAGMYLEHYLDSKARREILGIAGRGESCKNQPRRLCLAFPGGETDGTRVSLTRRSAFTRYEGRKLGFGPGCLRNPDLQPITVP